MKISPIAFFCFNRADKTRTVLEALAKNHLAKESEIFIFCDGPRNIRDLKSLQEVHKVIDSVDGFRKIHLIKREINHGSKESIIRGINQVLENSDTVIAVEDDILTSEGFLTFINQSLEFYKDQKNIWCVTGFNYPSYMTSFPKNYQEDVFFVKGKNSAWGWGIWKDRWEKVDFELKDFDEFSKNKTSIKEFNKAGSNLFEMLCLQKKGKIDAWDIQLSYAMFKNNAYTAHSSIPLVKNIGFDSSGTHTTCETNMTDFEFENKTEFQLKTIDQIPNNKEAEYAYTSPYRRSFFLLRWLKSKKRRKNFKWLIAGFLLSEILRLLF